MAASTISCAAPPESVRAAAAAHDRMLHEALRHFGERLKATVEEIRGVEGRQVSMDRRLAELDGRLLGLADEEAKRFASALPALGDRIETLEKGQKTLALSSRRAMQLAMSSRKRAEETRILPDWADSLRLEHLAGRAGHLGGAWTPGASSNPSCLQSRAGGSTPSLLGATQLDEQWLARIDDHERRLEDHERRISSFGEQLTKRAAAGSHALLPPPLPAAGAEDRRALTDAPGAALTDAPCAAGWSEDCLAVLQSSEARLEGSLAEISRRLDAVSEDVETQLRMPFHDVVQRQQRLERRTQQLEEQSHFQATKAQEVEVCLSLLRERVEGRGSASTGSLSGPRAEISSSFGAHPKGLGLLSRSQPGVRSTASLSSLAGAYAPFAA